MIWRDIEELFLSSTGAGGSPDAQAARLRFRFLSEAQRRIASVTKLPSLFTQAPLMTTANQDWVPAPDDCYAIDWMQNHAGGFKLKQEPGGSKGRAKFFEESTGRPPTGEIESVNFYWHEGGRIWLRDTPNEVGRLNLNYRFHSLKVTQADLDTEPAIPDQYHFQIAQIASGLYYELHPPLDPTTQMPMVSFGKGRVDAALAEITGQQQDPRAEENLDRQRVLRQPGYEMGGIR